MSDPETPLAAFSNRILDRKYIVREGEMIRCPTCGELHRLEEPDRGTPAASVLFYRRGENSYLGAVGGRLVLDVTEDAASAD